MSVTSGPITVEIREGMVTIARHVYEDTRCALTDDWPKWVEETLERIERKESAPAGAVTPPDVDQGAAVAPRVSGAEHDWAQMAENSRSVPNTGTERDK